VRVGFGARLELIRRVGRQRRADRSATNACRSGASSVLLRQAKRQLAGSSSHKQATNRAQNPEAVLAPQAGYSAAGLQEVIDRKAHEKATSGG